MCLYLGLQRSQIKNHISLSQVRTIRKQETNVGHRPAKRIHQRKSSPLVYSQRPKRKIQKKHLAALKRQQAHHEPKRRANLRNKWSETLEEKLKGRIGKA